jgi:predicted membrane-bound spermidine synthase
MVTGWLLLPALGTATTLRVLVALGAVLAWPLARTLRGSSPRLALGAVAGTVLLFTLAVSMMPDAATFWARLHATAPRQILFDEDGAGVSLLKAEGTGFGGSVAVYVNGLGQSWIPYGGVHTALGALPVLMHPAPRQVLIIGLGSGDTAFAAAGRSDLARLISVEIVGAQRRTLERLTLFTRYPGLMALLSDRRIEHRVGDGRAFLLHTQERFDVIEADALRPTSAYAGNLYSREYFDLVRRRLAPGGLAVTWAPTPGVERTFSNAFPYALGLGDIYVGSNDPIPYDSADVRRLAAALAGYHGPAGVDIVAVLEPYLDREPVRFGPDTPRDRRDLNTDVFPRDEFR